MGAAQFGYLMGAFVGSLLFAAVWLLFCKIVPALRRDASTSYTVAIVLSALPAFFISYGAGGIDIYAIVGAGLCILLLLWQKRRAQRKQVVASAIQGDA